MNGKFEILSRDFIYTCILIHPNEPLLFCGTSDGCVEVWRIDNREKIGELRYLKLDEFGEEVVVEDPVVNLAAPCGFDLVYAFMGNAAYCIDVSDLFIVQQIPISESVVYGNVSPRDGDVGVVTTTGYLSQWSAIFVERVRYLDMTLLDQELFLCFGQKEDEIILVYPDNKITLISLGEYPFLYQYQMDTDNLIANIFKLDNNDRYLARLTNGGITIIPQKKAIGGSTLRFQIEERLRTYIASQKILEEKKSYITDFRMKRLSRDRYVAELESLGQSKIQTSTVPKNEIKSMSSDSKTLTFALEEYYGGTLEEKSRSNSLIDEIANRHNVDPYYLFYAFRKGSTEYQIVEDAKRFEQMTLRRDQRIRQLIMISILLSSLILLVVEFFGTSIIELSIYGTMFSLQGLLLVYWRQLNLSPRLPRVNEYRALRVLLTIALLFSLVLLLRNLDLLRLYGIPL